MRIPAAIAFFLIAACSTPPDRESPDVLEGSGARSILRVDSDAAEEEVRRLVAFLETEYGYVPDGTHRELRALRDLLDSPERTRDLRSETSLSFGRSLVALTDFHFEPARANGFVEAANGPAGEAFADARVHRFLTDLRAAGLLHPDAGRDALRLTEGRADALRRLAAAPDGGARVVEFATLLPYRFRPLDAEPLLAAERPFLEAAEAAFLTRVLERLRLQARPGYLPELRLLADHAAAVVDLLRLAEGSGVTVAGPGGVLVLSRLAPDHRSLDETERGRFESLVRRVNRPDSGDFLALVTLAREPGMLDTIEILEDRYHYRFRTADARGIVRVARAGVPDVSLPEWVVEEGVPLDRPGLLLADRPLTAFVPPNDLLFLEALDRSRPELARLPRPRLERRIRRGLAGRPVRYRLGAPYTERADDLSRFTRPDLLKALLLLEALDRPEVRQRISDWIEEDLRDRTSEAGGYVRLGENGRLFFERYRGSARSARDDRLLLPPDPEGSALEFHFHATDKDDSLFAGPSSGGPGTDLFRAAHHRVDGVVITLLSERRFDTDLYSSGKTVLDLGVRPRGANR